MTRLKYGALAAWLCVACGSKDPDRGTAVLVSPNDDAGAASIDASADASPSATCEGACKTTNLVVTFGSKSESLTRAQFGFSKGDGGGAARLHLEAHDGGSSACPTTSSPQTDRTLVIEDLPEPNGGAAAVQMIGTSDGVRAAFFDFEGTLLPDTPLAKAKTVELRPSAIVRDASGALRGFALDVDMTFPQNLTLKGHLFAEYCPSMDE